MTVKKKTTKKTRRRRKPRTAEPAAETAAAPATAEPAKTVEVEEPDDAEATAEATKKFSDSVKAKALENRKAAAKKKPKKKAKAKAKAKADDGSNGKKKPARPPHRRPQPKQLIRPFPDNLQKEISRKAAEIRHAGGKGPPPPTKEKVPRGRFGAVGDTIVCANHKCRLRLLVEGTHVWSFNNPPRHGYEKGSCLCTRCACDFHPTIKRRWLALYERLVKRYGAKEADRVSVGTVLQQKSLRTANVSRMR